MIEGDFDRAERLLRESMALAADDDHLLVAQIWGGLGYLEVFRGNTAAGIEPIKRAIAIHRELGIASSLPRT